MVHLVLDLYILESAPHMGITSTLLLEKSRCSAVTLFLFSLVLFPLETISLVCHLLLLLRSASNMRKLP